MNRSYLRVRLGTSISPYRGSTCYTSIHIPKHWQRSSGRHRKGDEKSLFTFTIFRNVSWLYLFIFFFKKKKRVLPEAGERKRNRRGEEKAGATSPLPLLFSDHPYLLSPSPGPVRSDFSNEVIGREDGWREISTHKTPFTSKGKTKVRSCAPAEERSFGSLPY